MSSSRPIYLLKVRPTSRQRAHFAIFIPSSESSHQNPHTKDQSCKGTKIHVVGTALAMALQFVSNFDCLNERSLEAALRLGEVDEEVVVQQKDSTDDEESEQVVERTEPVSKIEREAMSVRPPRGGNVLKPPDDFANRRCQEWTMDYIRLLVHKGYLDEAAVEIAQAEKDPPDFGVGLRSTGHSLW